MNAPALVRPVLPAPTSSSVEALTAACLAVCEWAPQCDDIAEAAEALARLAAIEQYLERRDLAGPAQEAARWLEVRIGELLGTAEHGGDRSQVTRELLALSKMDRWRFRKMAAHRDLVAELVPTSRARILKAIKQAEARRPDVAAAERTDAPTTVPPTEPDPTSFATVVIDPPWRYDNTATRGAAEDHYGTMSLDELAALRVPVAENAHVYLWVTNPFIREGFGLLDAWGLTYKTCLTWCKPQIGMGNYFRGTTEHVLFAMKGRLPTNRNDVPTHFVANRTKHSAKPESFYDLVESCSPGPYLEMFARRRRFGWHVWGTGSHFASLKASRRRETFASNGTRPTATGSRCRWASASSSPTSSTRTKNTSSAFAPGGSAATTTSTRALAPPVTAGRRN